jgi:hypothetical protein
LPERNLAIVNADQPRPLWDKQEIPGRAIKDVLRYLAVICPGRSDRMPVISDAGMMLPACTT